MRFEKWQALGNDYVIIEADELPWSLNPERIRAICRPHLGVGADGILLLSPAAEAEAIARVQIFNPDGSEAELSGNGVREAVMYLRRHSWTDRDTFTVITAAGPITPTVLDTERCAVAMGRAAVTSPDNPDGGSDGRGRLVAGGREWEFQHVAVGNPQCAIAVGGDELEQLPIAEFGAEIERHQFFPNRTNVSFYRAEGSRVRARIFERGVGETLSSGTGACGAAVAAHLAGAPDRLTVELDGGELEVEIGADLELTLTGWAKPVYAGRLSDEMIAALA
ncbi:MAG TPA: diaminopimelate epimerase [Solirubrobacterales bacterium]|nr:diaminopimelate epimerase [Solirubrobacterales bacterium]